MSSGVICIVSTGLVMFVRFVVAGRVFPLFRANYGLRVPECNAGADYKAALAAV